MFFLLVECAARLGPPLGQVVLEMVFPEQGNASVAASLPPRPKLEAVVLEVA